MKMVAQSQSSLKTRGPNYGRAWRMEASNKAGNYDQFAASSSIGLRLQLRGLEMRLNRGHATC